MDYGRIRELFDGNEDVLSLDMGSETVCTSAHVTLGGTVDDTTELSLAFHEIAHFIEASDDMVTLHDFGLSERGARGRKLLEKEIDVFAIQVVLENHYGTAWTDRFWRNYEDMAHFCKNVVHNSLSEVEVEILLEARVAHWTLDAVMVEFGRKITLMREANSFAQAA